MYAKDPDIINTIHCHTMTALGIKHKIFDGEFLDAVTDLIKTHGISFTFGEFY